MWILERWMALKGKHLTFRRIIVRKIGDEHAYFAWTIYELVEQLAATVTLNSIPLLTCTGLHLEKSVDDIDGQSQGPR